MFNPDLLGLDQLGAHALAFDSVQRCDIDIRQELFSNIVAAGGSTLFKGFQERLNLELRKLVSATTHVKVIASPERKDLSWIGGSIVSSLSTFRRCWVTREKYIESGMKNVHNGIRGYVC